MKLKQKIKSISAAVMCAAFFCAGALTVNGENYSEEMKYGDYLSYKQIDKDKDGTYDYVEITDCDKSAVKIIIPSEIGGLPVKSIGGNIAFHNCSSLVSVEIPNSVTSMYHYSFIGCSSLTSINVSENNENYRSIDGILYNKTQSELIRYPEGKKDKNYSIPNSVTLIEEGAFMGCSSLTNIEIPNSLNRIVQNAFSDCISLTSIKIPDSVTTIDMFAFYNCSSLTSIEIPNSVSYIGYSVFHGCSSLKSVKIPSSVAKIGDYAFQDCSGLTSIEIPKFGLSLIGEGTFSGCSNLTSIEIPKSVTEIRGSAFYGCSSLTSIEIPSRVTSIGMRAFNSCSNLTSINVLENNKNYSSIDGVLYNKTQAELIKYPEGKIGKNYFIASRVTSIGNYAFQGCSGLTSIYIPNSVTSIGKNAFSGCTSLTSIEIPNSVTSIGEYAFYNCTGLTSITIKNPECEIYDSINTISDTAAIYGYSNSTAQAYAEKYNRKFVSINEESIKGDADGNGKIAIKDSVFIAKMIARGQRDQIPMRADFNGDGKCSIKDAVDIAKYIAREKLQKR